MENKEIQLILRSLQICFVTGSLSAKPNQVLITQVVEVQSKSGTPANVFYGIFKDSLSKMMGAIKQEVERKSPSVSQNKR
ncbi:hypothetical protein NUACC21_29750 [Scytonema sp. NUACC21]